MVDFDVEGILSAYFNWTPCKITPSVDTATLHPAFGAGYFDILWIKVFPGSWQTMRRQNARYALIDWENGNITGAF